MSQTSYPNTLIYECSSANAEVNISSNEWINNFSEGIDLMPGDTIRILGSFINEKGQGDQIEITEENNKFTLEYMPIHNLYQYSKLSNDYAAPNDTTRTDLNKLQYSNILNFDTPSIYDGNGSQILACPGTTRAARAYDGCPINRYYNRSGYDLINPNEQYLDAELVKSITCPHVDGISIQYIDDSGSKATPQYFDFPDKGGNSPWGGDISPFGGLKKQLAFGSFYFHITNDGADVPTFSLDLWGQGTAENLKPTGVTGKVMGVKYTKNVFPVEYSEFTTDNFAVGELPLVTFMVSNHVVETKIDESTINPNDPQYNGFVENPDLGGIQLEADNLNQINGPRNKNGSTFSVGKNGTSAPNIMDRMMDGFTSGFTSYTEGSPQSTNKIDGSSLYYEFYNTGPQALNNFQLAGVQTFCQENRVIKANGKVYYQIFIRGLGDSNIIADDIFYRFLKPYDPENIMDTSYIGNRIFLPIHVAESELQFDPAGAAGVTITDETYMTGQYRDDAAGSTTTTGGMILGANGLQNDNNINFAYNDNVQQPIRPGFQTNINMMSGTNLKTTTTDSIRSDPLGSLNRKAGGYPALNYDDQLQDMIDYKQDCYMIQTRKANFEIPTGFYTPDRLANVVNDLLHLNNDNYKKKFGEGNITGEKLYDNWCYAPTNINGPFLSTKIPECNGGYIPPDTKFVKADLSVSKRPPGLRLDNTEYVIKTQNLYAEGNSAADVIASFDPSSSNLVEYDMKNAFTDPLQFILCPYPFPRYERNQFQFSSVDGTETPSQLYSGDIGGNDSGDISATILCPNVWNDFLEGCFHPCPMFMGVGSYRTDGVLSTQTFAIGPDTTGEMGEGVLGRVQNIPFGNASKLIKATPFVYFTGHGMGVLNRNGGGFLYGGLSRAFMGANDLTFLYDDDEERFGFTNSYTPFRPAGFESSKDKDEFTVDDAVPSVLINTDYEGFNLYAITQIYIFSITAMPVCKTESNNDERLTDFVDNANPAKQKAGSIELWSSLGFTGLPTVITAKDGSVSFKNDFRWCDDIFYQKAIGDTEGTIVPIYNIAELNPSFNGQNPAKSQCLIMLPNREFLVQTIAEEYKAPNPPSLTTYPFYLIGSSIPSKFYHGSKTGTELPVVGICARNFNAGSFVFDLSQSSVEWTISEKVTLTSIHTKILKNDFSNATNLFGNSAVIYAVTKNNFYNQIPIDQATKIEQDREKDIEKATQQYDLTPIPVQPTYQYIIPSVAYQQLIEEDSD